MTHHEGAERDVKKIVGELSDLMQLDVDAVEAYDEAIEKIENREWRTRLSEFRDDHKRHVSELERAISALGEEAPERSTDFKGSLIEGMTALRSSMGDEQAMKAMHQNERLTNRNYEKAAEKDYLTPEVREIVERGLADERRHIQWIEQQVSVHAGAGSRGESGSGH